MFVAIVIFLYNSINSVDEDINIILLQHTKKSVNNDTVCFQAIVAALVYLTATCNGLSSGYSAILFSQLRANSSGFETDEEVESWIGKGRDLFYLHKQVNLPQSGTRDLYEFFKFEVPVLIN
jgi:hypothetical protein